MNSINKIGQIALKRLLTIKGTRETPSRLAVFPGSEFDISRKPNFDPILYAHDPESTSVGYSMWGIGLGWKEIFFTQNQTIREALVVSLFRSCPDPITDFTRPSHIIVEHRGSNTLCNIHRLTDVQLEYIIQEHEHARQFMRH